MIPSNIDQVLQGLERNIDHLDKENFNKLLVIFLQQIQILQDHTVDIAGQKNISTAAGVWLDWIGKIIGKKRGSMSDQQYREALRLGIAINSADATPNSIINITKVATGSNSSKIIDYHPAAFVNSISTTLYTDISRYKSLVDSIRAVGVKPMIVNNIQGDRLTPAWRIKQDFVEGEYTLAATRDGFKEDLLVNGQPLHIYAKVTAAEYILNVNVGGVSESLLVNGQPLLLYAQVSPKDLLINKDHAYLQYKGEPNNTKGYLAQRIFKDVIAVFSSLAAESLAEEYFAAGASFEVSLDVYPE